MTCIHKRTRRRPKKLWRSCETSYAGFITPPFSVATQTCEPWNELTRRRAPSKKGGLPGSEKDLGRSGLTSAGPRASAPARHGYIKPHLKEYWVIPPKANAAFVAAMEDVLEVYTRPHDAARPLVCLDETSKQLVAETRTPLPARPGRPARYDYEYERNGTASLFMLFAPLEGWREVKVTERRTAIDYAQVLKELSDVHFPKAEKIVLVQDNLNTHNPASLYEAFTALEARRLVERFEWHYTPKHGSWLNMAESELAILSNQCLDRRIADPRSLRRQVAAWLLERNTYNVKANWRFTAADARIKLKSLYPAL